MIGALLLAVLVCSGSVTACVNSGVQLAPPPGFSASNLDPMINSPLNNEIYDPNFIPGFQAGLTNYSITWGTGHGFAKIGYSVGPWTHEEFSIPHFAVGPQCCNFVEVPHTQQFRLPSWGDYYYVKAGMGPPGINVQNFTAVFGGPTSYVGLRTDWDWTAAISLNWTAPALMNPANEWAAIGVSVTQVVPTASDKLVYTLINFWMDGNSSGTLSSGTGVRGKVSGPNLVSYHPLQMQTEGNQTVSIDLTPYLSDTLRVLNVTASQDQPPVIAYVYLNVEGYNFRWNSTLWSFHLLTNSPQVSASSPMVAWGALVLAAGVVAVAMVFLIRMRSLRPAISADHGRED